MVRSPAQRTAVAAGLALLTLAAASPAGPLRAQAPAPADSAGPAGADTAARTPPDSAFRVPVDTAAAAGDTAVSDPATTPDSAAAPPALRLRGRVEGGGKVAAVRIVLAPSVRLPPVTAYRLRLSWDPAALELQGVDPGGFGGEFSAEPGAAGPGRLVAKAERADGGADSTAALFSARFAAGSALEGGERADVVVEVRELRGEGGATLADSLTGDLPAPCLQALPPGDVDGDGEVTSRDAVSLLRRHVGMKVERSADVSRGDLNADGAADTADAARMLRRQVGLPPAADSASAADSSGAPATSASGSGRGASGGGRDDSAGRPPLGACR